MKSNQERSNECLPPKKREILAMEEKAVVVASASESQRGENLAWLASVAIQSRSGWNSADHSAYGVLFAPLPSCRDHPVYPAATQRAVHQPSLRGHYAGYISSQLISPTATSTPALVQRPHLEAYGSAVVSQASKGDQHHLLGTPPPPQSTHQYVQMAGSPLSVTAGTVASPGGHLPLHSAVLPHTLTLTPSQVVVQYADSPVAKKDEGRTRELLNGEVEKGRRYGLLLEASLIKQSGVAKAAHGQPQQHYETQHVVIPADYTQETSGLRTSLMLVPNSHGNSGGAEQDCGPEKPPSSVAHNHSQCRRTDLHGRHRPSFYHAPQPPIIGYIASGGQQQQTVSYHATLPQHLLIPSGQSLLVPVSASGGGEQEPPHAVVTSPQQNAVSASHSYIATAIPKCELVGVSEQQATGAYPATATAGGLVQAQLNLPVPAAPAPLLPPYFMKGSIIQLADGELKRVEDLRTEDFIQSAEISGELKIDSSTVERIDGSPTPNSAIIQFSVGEHRVQVSVEVLVEYPFFVFGQGWSSCCPDRTTQLFELSCAKLSVGDVCISLTLKNLKNGSLRKSQSQAAGVPLKPPKAETQHRDRGGNCREQENGLGQWAGGVEGRVGGIISENGELKSGEKTCSPQALKTESGGTDRPSGRKRRWSAPEGRQVEKSGEGPSPPLPKTTFIPQEVKICIEGRSNIGK
ncbi:hypothetical protein ANANG_G00011250 [Anguilla anguilla]|uniref:AXH domain-containing protein n=1 Tax=Anguilla anguilla TaxID=7936 RepID=A0A9D3MX82_ANGAN|nr:hypothetical protein ANANG_G00011250 [Anguilla anguilla]